VEDKENGNNTLIIAIVIPVGVITIIIVGILLYKSYKYL